MISLILALNFMDKPPHLIILSILQADVHFFVGDLILAQTDFLLCHTIRKHKLFLIIIINTMSA